MAQKTVTFPDKQDLRAVTDAIRQLGAANVNELKKIINDNANDAQTRLAALEELIVTYESLKAFIESDDYNFKLVPLLAEIDEALQGDGIYFSNWLGADVVEDGHGNVRDPLPYITLPNVYPPEIDQARGDIFQYQPTGQAENSFLMTSFKRKPFIIHILPIQGANWATPILQYGTYTMQISDNGTMANYNPQKEWLLTVMPFAIIGTVAKVSIILREFNPS